MASKNTLPTIDIKGQRYVLVKDRVLEFNKMHMNGKIETELHSYQGERVIVKAKVTPDSSNPERYFTGYSQALESQGMVNKTSALENAETSAVGRALAMMGIGVLDSIASADEMAKAGATGPDKVPTTLDPEKTKKVFWAKFFALKDYTEASNLLEQLKDSNVLEPDKTIIEKKIIGKRNTLAKPDLEAVGAQLPTQEDVPF